MKENKFVHKFKAEMKGKNFDISLCCFLIRNQNEYELFSSGLHICELNRYREFKHEKRKQSYILGRLAARAAIAELLGNDQASRAFVTNGVFNHPINKRLL